MSLVKETDVLTPKGVKEINRVEIGDEIYSLNLSTGKVEVEKVAEKQVADYSGKILHFYNRRRVDLFVVPSHWMIFMTCYGTPIRKGEAGWVAKNMKNKWCFITPSNLPEKNGNACISFFRSKDQESLLKLLGWYTAEGCILESGRSSECSIACKRKEEIKELLDEMGIRYRELLWDVRFRDNELCEALRFYCGRASYQKKIDHSLFGLSKCKLNALFDAMLKGDGYTDPRRGKPQYYSTVSEQLVRDFVWLANYIGYATSVKKRTVESRRSFGAAKGNPRNWRDLFLIYLSGQRKVTRHINVEEESYNGEIYDLTVEGNHSFFAGAKNSGKFILSGDSYLSQDDQVRLPIEIKRHPPVICPKCGELGSLHRPSVHGRRYWRVFHKIECGGEFCWLGRGPHEIKVMTDDKIKMMIFG